MDLRRWTGTSFVSRAPTKGGEDVELRVTELALPHVLWWHSHVQPVIDEAPDRTDRGWNWLLYLPFTRVAGGVLRRRPAGYSVGIVASEPGHFIPCALVQLLGRSPRATRAARRFPPSTPLPRFLCRFLPRAGWPASRGL